MCNQGDAVGSTWIWNFQPMRRRYVTRTSDDVHQASFLPQNSNNYAHGPWRNRSGCSCKQGLCWVCRRKIGPMRQDPMAVSSLLLYVFTSLTVPCNSCWHLVSLSSRKIDVYYYEIEKMRATLVYWYANSFKASLAVHSQFVVKAVGSFSSYRASPAGEYTTYLTALVPYWFISTWAMIDYTALVYKWTLTKLALTLLVLWLDFSRLF